MAPSGATVLLQASNAQALPSLSVYKGPTREQLPASLGDLEFLKMLAGVGIGGFPTS